MPDKEGEAWASLYLLIVHVTDLKVSSLCPRTVELQRKYLMGFEEGNGSVRE